MGVDTRDTAVYTFEFVDEHKTATLLYDFTRPPSAKHHKPLAHDDCRLDMQVLDVH